MPSIAAPLHVPTKGPSIPATVRLASGDLTHRVVVRFRLDDGSATDVLGVLERLDRWGLAVRRADGTLVEVPYGRALAAKRIPARRVTRREVRSVELAAARGWPGLEQAWVGGWLLRSGGGFTSRANSCVPLGPPDRPLDAAIAAMTAWYAARELPPRFQLPVLLGAQLDRHLAARGWTEEGPAVVLTASLDRSGGGEDESVRAASPVELIAAPDAGWLERYRYRGSELPPPAPAVLAAVEGEVLAVGRGAVSLDDHDELWLGLTAVEVAPPARRRGLAHALVAALLDWGRLCGAVRAYAQVAADNADGLAFWERIGFAEHHRYAYRAAPGQPPGGAPQTIRDPVL